MNCLICGKETERPLCDNCITDENLDKLFHYLGDPNVDFTDMPYLKEFAAEQSLTDSRKVLFKVLEEYDRPDLDYYWCRAHALVFDDEFEECALQYLNTHEEKDARYQRVLFDLLKRYQFKSYDKPEQWCRMILNTPDLCSELYYKAAEFFAIVGDYNDAEQLIEKTLNGLQTGTCTPLLYSAESECELQEKLKSKITTYRTKRPYWPSKEEQRVAIAKIYDAKGIEHPVPRGIKPKKVKESEFQPLSECYDAPETYVSFWCKEVFSKVIGDICELGAVKIIDGNEEECFHQYVKPWKSTANAIKSLNMDLQLKKAPDVDIVMKEFLAFAKGHVLLAPGALEKQGKLLARAARYTGLNKIDNAFFDVVEYAEDMSDTFEVCTREKLLEKYKLSESDDALENAKTNVKLFNSIKGA